MSDQIRQSLIEAYVEKRVDLRRFVVARIGSDADADDLVQEIYVRIQKASLPQEIANPVAFLYRVAANLAVDYRRDHQRRSTRDRQAVELNSYAQTGPESTGVEAIADTVSPDQAIDAKRRVAEIIMLIQELSLPCRRVFLMHKFEGLSHADVAERLNISRKTVEKHMTTALKLLTSRLGRDAAESETG